MNLRLRPAEEGDLERLREITVTSKAHWGHDPARVRQWVAAEDFPGAALARGEAELAEVDGAIAGWVAVIPRGEIAWLEDLWVDPPFMGGGVGTALFRHAVDRAAALGARRLEWESDAGAVGFYERMGGRRVRDSTTTEVGRVLPIMALDLGQGGEDVSARGRADPR